MLIGFGVGLSWAGCTWTETWQPRQAGSAASADQRSLLDARPGTNGDGLAEKVCGKEPTADIADS